MKKIVITYPYFLPAYKAGGPIQSIANLCRHLKDEYSFFIICSSTDHGESTRLGGINPDTWNDFENGTASVYYFSANKLKRSAIRQLIEEVAPHHVFINGIYSPFFTILPLVFSHCPRSVSVRGMLHAGALSQKRFKKRIFLSFLKMFGLRHKVIFHATDSNEQLFIKHAFGKGSNVVVAQNFPNIVTPATLPFKEKGVLKIVSIALISPMKNHALVLQALQKCSSAVQYDIFGPIKDPAYWQECEQLIEKLPLHIQVHYKGSVQPPEVTTVMAQYHCYIQPSKSENFGHSLYEALASGLPVITSRFTPWNDLEENNAGFNVDIANISTITKAIEKIAVLNNPDLQQWSDRAKAFAKRKTAIEETKQQYRLLFQ